VIEPRWLTVAKGELGVKEIPGSGDNPRIVEYHQTTTLKATDDAVPWCSSFVNWCLEQAGVRGTKSAAASSWRDWGEELEEGRLGCIVVMRRQGGNHVGFYMSEDADGVFVLGGNQGDAVNVKHFPWEIVTHFRWPEGEE